MRELTRLELGIASEVFARYSKRDFAYGYYKAPRQVTTTTTATTATMVATTFVMPVEIVDCKAEVAGLDQSAFIDALEEFQRLCKEKTFEIISQRDDEHGYG